MSLTGEVGQDIDVVNVWVGRGANLQANVVLRFSAHVTLDLLSSWSWLDVARDDGAEGRLFTAQVERVKLVYNFSARLYLRLIGEYVQEHRDPDLYVVPVSAFSGSFSGSALLAYRLNWQTALFAGYGDNREEITPGRFVPQSRQIFVKMSYAFQR